MIGRFTACYTHSKAHFVCYRKNHYRDYANYYFEYCLHMHSHKKWWWLCINTNDSTLSLFFGTILLSVIPAKSSLKPPICLSMFIVLILHVILTAYIYFWLVFFLHLFRLLQLPSSITQRNPSQEWLSYMDGSN